MPLDGGEGPSSDNVGFYSANQYDWDMIRLFHSHRTLDRINSLIEKAKTNPNVKWTMKKKMNNEPDHIMTE